MTPPPSDHPRTATDDARPPGALEGVRVLEWSTTTAAAYAGKILSDLGAEVLLIEGPGGSPLRAHEPLVPGSTAPVRSGRFVYLHTGKRSVVVADGPVGDAAVAELAAAADVVIADPGSRLATSGEPAPSAVWCSIRPFGASGPYAGFRGNHLTVFHAGGEGHLLPSGAGFEQFPDRPPIQIGSDMGDFDTGATAAVAILAALLAQHDTGAGESIDVSAQEAQLTLNRTRLSRFNNDGVELRRGPSPYGGAGMIPCLDGAVQLLGLSEDHWQRLAAVPETRELAAARAALGADTQAAGRLIREWCAAHPKTEVVEVFGGVGAPVGAYATPADLLASAQLGFRSFFCRVNQPGLGTVTLPGAPYRLSETPARSGPAPGIGGATGFSGPPAPRPAATSGPGADGPLGGVRVVDFTWAAAGPYGTLLLALLGAEVIKVESTRRPDPARRGFMADYGGINRSPNFNELNLNKRSLQVDLTHERGLETVKRLIAKSDVVVNNFRPGVMDRYGLGAEALLAAHPSLIVASSSANGSRGPEALTAGLASIFGASGGLGEQTGYADGPPTEVGESTDYRSGNALAIAILAALYHRRRTGAGQSIDLASREVVVATAPDALLAHGLGVSWQPRSGNDHRRVVPHGVYPAQGQDAWIALATADESEWAALCGLLGRPEWADELASEESRAAARDTIDAAVASWTATRPAAEAFVLLQAAGVSAAPSFTNAELASDPHLAARGVFVAVEHPEIGQQRVMRAPWTMASTPCTIERHGPLLGADNRYVLETILGLPRGTEWADEEAFR